MGRRGRRRRLEGRTKGRDARQGRFVEVRVERAPRSKRNKPAKVTKRRRRNGNVTEETYEV